MRMMLKKCRCAYEEHLILVESICEKLVMPRTISR